MPDREQVLYSTEWFAIATDARGEQFVHCGDEVLVVALTGAGEVIFAREPSAAFGGDTLILPGGSTEPGESHSQTANRELREEVGLQAARVDELGELRRWSKYLKVRTFVYLARELSEAPLPGDEPYEVGVERIPLADVEQWCEAGALWDAGAIAAVLLARRYLASHPS
jgi:ADP-ribose diphosphatase